jgi:hypothetical protein
MTKHTSTSSMNMCTRGGIPELAGLAQDTEWYQSGQGLVIGCLREWGGATAMVRMGARLGYGFCTRPLSGFEANRMHKIQAALPVNL